MNKPFEDNVGEETSRLRFRLVDVASWAAILALLGLTLAIAHEVGFYNAFEENGFKRVFILLPVDLSDHLRIFVVDLVQLATSWITLGTLLFPVLLSVVSIIFPRNRIVKIVFALVTTGQKDDSVPKVRFPLSIASWSPIVLLSLYAVFVLVFMAFANPLSGQLSWDALITFFSVFMFASLAPAISGKPDQFPKYFGVVVSWAAKAVAPLFLIGLAFGAGLLEGAEAINRPRYDQIPALLNSDQKLNAAMVLRNYSNGKLVWDLRCHLIWLPNDAENSKNLISWGIDVPTVAKIPRDISGYQLPSWFGEKYRFTYPTEAMFA
jgi:hypothetical protein